MQELGLSSYSSESREATSKASSDGQQYHALFNTFYKLVYEHIASLVEVNPLAPLWLLLMLAQGPL